MLLKVQWPARFRARRRNPTAKRYEALELLAYRDGPGVSDPHQGRIV